MKFLLTISLNGVRDLNFVIDSASIRASFASDSVMNTCFLSSL